METYLGNIIMVAFNFAPPGWAMCNGQLLPINTNQALFALLGTTFGGDGTTTFGLPDLRGRVPLGAGQGSFLPNYTLGESGNFGSANPVRFPGPAPENQPGHFLAVNYLIALQGIFPSRS